jgi:hypothetical protein
VFLQKGRKKGNKAWKAPVDQRGPVRQIISLLITALKLISVISRESVPHRYVNRDTEAVRRIQNKLHRTLITHTFPGLLAKIKCSICSYQFNI